MKRLNGYFDLDEYFKRILNRKTVNLDILEQKKIIRPEYGGINSVFWFKYFGVDILFKAYKSEYQIYSELLSEELAKYLDIKHAQYDAATFMNFKGLISYSFKKENYNYIHLGDILDYYIERLIVTENSTNTYGDYLLKDYSRKNRDYLINNIEDIWNAVEYYLYNEILVEEYMIPDLIEKFMIQLTDYFIYQIISGNYDMHSGNILVAVANDYSDIELAPLYDNEDIFQLSGKLQYDFSNTPRLMLERGSLENGDTAIEMLEKYLTISDSFFVNRFLYKINILNEKKYMS